MMIGVAESLISSKGFDGNHMAQTFVKKLQVGALAGLCSRSASVFRWIKAGVPWNEAFWRAGSYGNGAAIYCFLRNYQSFKEAVAYAVSLGGDRDTIGAMTGAISGAYHGLNAIPHEWLSKLEKRFHMEKPSGN